MMGERESPHCVVANVVDSNIVISEFELQSYDYVQFWMNTHKEGVNPVYPPAKG